MELLDVVDRAGNPTGKLVSREAAHRYGILHRTSHVWIYRLAACGAQILLQKRSAQKDAFAGCYDVSSAGHIPAGEDYRTSAVRELFEELGVRASPGALRACGFLDVCWDGAFHGAPFHDRQVTQVFLLHLQNDAPQDFCLQRSEVSAVRWMELRACAEAVRCNTIAHCISLRELRMLERGDRWLQF